MGAEEVPGPEGPWGSRGGAPPPGGAGSTAQPALEPHRPGPGHRLTAGPLPQAPTDPGLRTAGAGAAPGRAGWCGLQRSGRGDGGGWYLKRKRFGLAVQGLFMRACAADTRACCGGSSARAWAPGRVGQPIGGGSAPPVLGGCLRPPGRRAPLSDGPTGLRRTPRRHPPVSGAPGLPAGGSAREEETGAWAAGCAARPPRPLRGGLPAGWPWGLQAASPGEHEPPRGRRPLAGA